MADDPTSIAPRWRAVFNRPPAHARIDALLSRPDASLAVAQLAPTELHELVHEVGFEDAGDIIALASPAQLQVCIDLDGWDADRLLLDPIKPWLTGIIEAGFEKVAEVWHQLDSELRALFFQRHTTIYDLTLGEEPDDDDEQPLYFTVDSFFAVKLLGSEDNMRLVRRLLDDLYRGDANLARHTLAAARSEPLAHLEEMSYRWRTGRVADLGYPDFYEALEIFRPLEASQVSIGEGSEERVAAAIEFDSDGRRVLPLVVAEQVAKTSFLAKALDRVSDATDVQRIETSIVFLVNRILAAGRARPGPPEIKKNATAYAMATTSLGVETVSRGDVERAAAALRTIALVRLFRVGYTATVKLATLARGLAPQSPLAPSPIRECFAALVSPRPMFSRLADLPPSAGLRCYESLADLRRGAQLVALLAARTALVEVAGVSVPALSKQPEPRPGLDDLIRTALIRAMIGGRFDATALGHAELNTWRDQALTSGRVNDALRITALETVARTLRQAQAALAPEQVTALCEGWLGDLERILGTVRDRTVDPRFIEGLLLEVPRS
jgi:hypothetical protein